MKEEKKKKRQKRQKRQKIIPVAIVLLAQENIRFQFPENSTLPAQGAAIDCTRFGFLL